jgi:hypothetical protein
LFPMSCPPETNAAGCTVLGFCGDTTQSDRNTRFAADP